MQLPGPTITSSTHPLVNVVVGIGGTVASQYEHVDTTAAHAHTSVGGGFTVVTTVAVGEQKSPPGRVPSVVVTSPAYGPRAALPFSWPRRPRRPRPVMPWVAAAEVHVAQLPQPGLLKTSTVAVHAPLAASRVVVVGGRGVGPVGSPAEQLEVGTMQTGQIPKRNGVVVVVVEGVTQYVVVAVGAGDAKTLQDNTCN